MKPDAYKRNIAARAFDVARYLLFWGVPTNVGQVTSIRTLEKQIKRLRVSAYEEVRSLGEEIAAACAAEPDCQWDDRSREPLAPTLARHAEPDESLPRSRADLKQWAAQNLPPAVGLQVDCVDLVRPSHVGADIAATLLYSVTDRPFRELYDMAAGWSDARRREVLDVALGSRGRRDDLPRWIEAEHGCCVLKFDVAQAEKRVAAGGQRGLTCKVLHHGLISPKFLDWTLHNYAQS